MPIWVDPFTGQIVDTDSPDPIGGPYPVIPYGSATYASEHTVNLLTTPIGPGTKPGDIYYGSDPSLEFDRGPVFYMPGDEWRVIQGVGDLASLQAALEAAGVLNGDYLIGSPDEKTAAAMKIILASANASGQSWVDILRGSLAAAEAAKAGRGSGSGSGSGGAAFISDDDIKAVLNKTAQGVIGRNLREDELGGMIGSFRTGIGGGTSPTVVAEQTVRGAGTAGEAAAHDTGNVLAVISQMLGGTGI